MRLHVITVPCSFLCPICQFAFGGQLGGWLLGLCFAFCLQAGRVFGQLFGVRKECGLAGDVFPQDLGDLDTVLPLVVFEHTAQGSLGGAQGGVESVNVVLLVCVVRLLLLSVADLEFSSLVVGAVGAGHELLVLTLEWEPGLQVVLLGGSIVESTGNDGDDAVGDVQGLVEFFGGVDHLVKVLP